jgi:hypothetical protein
LQELLRRPDTAKFADHLDEAARVVPDLPLEALRPANHVGVELSFMVAGHDVPRMFWRNFPEPSSMVQNDQPFRLGLTSGL